MSSFKKHLEKDILTESVDKGLNNETLIGINKEALQMINEGFFDDMVQSVKTGAQSFKDKRAAAKYQKLALKMIRILNKQLQKSQKQIDKAYPTLLKSYKDRLTAFDHVKNIVSKKGGDFSTELNKMLDQKILDTQEAMTSILDIEKGTQEVGKLDPSAIDTSDVEPDADLLNPKEALKKAITISNEMDAKKAKGIVAKMKKALGNKFKSIYSYVDQKLDKIPLINKLPKKLRNRIIFIVMLNLVSGGIGYALSPAMSIAGIGVNDIAEIVDSIDADPSEISGMIDDPSAVEGLLDASVDGAESADVSDVADFDLSDAVNPNTSRFIIQGNDLKNMPPFTEWVQGESPEAQSLIQKLESARQEYLNASGIEDKNMIMDSEVNPLVDQLNQLRSQGDISVDLNGQIISPEQFAQGATDQSAFAQNMSNTMKEAFYKL
jgi:hypothetical protein